MVIVTLFVDGSHHAVVSLGLLMEFQDGKKKKKGASPHKSHPQMSYVSLLQCSVGQSNLLGQIQRDRK